MKKVLTIIGLLSLSSGFAQKLSDYPYIIIPENFEDFENNQFQLKSRLSYFLGQKNYTILSNDASTWPSEVQENPCLATTANMKRVKSMLTNKLELSFSNCEHQIIEQMVTTSKIKEYDKGYQEALKMALNKIAPQQANVKNLEHHATKKLKVVQKKETFTPPVQKPETQAVSVNQPVTNDAQLYKMGDNSYKLINATKGTYLLVNATSDELFARLIETDEKGKYQAVILDRNGEYVTNAYENGNEIMVELKENGRLKLVHFIK